MLIAPLASPSPRRTFAPAVQASSPPSPLRPARAAPRRRPPRERRSRSGTPAAASTGSAGRCCAPPVRPPTAAARSGQRRQAADCCDLLAAVKMLRWRERAIVIERPALEQQVRAAADVRLQRTRPLDPAKTPAQRPVRSPQRPLDTRRDRRPDGREGVPHARVDLIREAPSVAHPPRPPARLVLALTTHLVHARHQRKPIMLLMNEEHRLVADHAQIPLRR